MSCEEEAVEGQNNLKTIYERLDQYEQTNDKTIFLGTNCNFVECGKCPLAGVKNAKGHRELCDVVLGNWKPGDENE